MLLLEKIGRVVMPIRSRLRSTLVIIIFNVWIDLCQSGSVSGLDGILKVRAINSDMEKKYCYHYDPSISQVPVLETEIIYNRIYKDTLVDLCHGDIPTPDTVSGLTIFARLEPNCSMIEHAIEAENEGVESVIYIGKWPEYLNVSNMTSVSVGGINNITYFDILKLSENETLEVGFYSSLPNDQVFCIYNLLVIWIMAEFSIIVGAYWSGTIRYRLYLKEQNEAAGEPRQVEGGAMSNNHRVKEESSLRLQPRIILILVLIMCIMMVCLWFLLEYLVFIIIALFSVASFFAVYGCLEPLVLMIPCGRCRTPYFNLYVVQGVLEVRQILLLLVSATLPVIWFVFRKNQYSWILQDILGIAFSINVIRVIRLPSLMICTLLLSLLVLYDIFFVFITPFITSSGTSIMVDVAQGGSSNEELPMVLKVPYFFYPEYYDVCEIRNYSLLGFGDILVPGLLISYVHFFDLKVGTPHRLYFLVNIIGYGIGLLVTFAVLLLMRGAQPALFYLVPATLIPTVVIAAARGDLSLMWTNKTFAEKNHSDGIGDYPPIVQADPPSSSSATSDGLDSFHDDALADRSPITAPSPQRG